MFEEGRLERHVRVTVEYEDIAGGSYSHEWEVDPSHGASLKVSGMNREQSLVPTGHIREASGRSDHRFPDHL